MFLHGQRGAGVLSRLCACFSSRLPLPCRLLPSPSRLSPSPLECGFSSEAGDRDAPAKPAWESEGKVKYANFLLESFDGTFGRGLLPDSLEGLSELEKARKLYEAPFVCAAHEFTERGVKAGQGPVMVYGNLKAQRAFGLSWDDFLGFPSSKTADPSQQTERNALIQKCSENGWVSVAGIVRVRSDGSFFRVKDGVLWTLLERVGGKEGEGETGVPAGRESEGGGDGDLVFGHAVVFSAWDSLGSSTTNEGPGEWTGSKNKCIHPWKSAATACPDCPRRANSKTNRQSQKRR